MTTTPQRQHQPHLSDQPTIITTISMSTEEIAHSSLRSTASTKIENTAPLTPPNSECSSDVENSNPNSAREIENSEGPTLRDKEMQTISVQTAESKAASYTFDTLLVADGRSKNRKQSLLTTSQSPNENLQPLEVALGQKDANLDMSEYSHLNKYICSECGQFLGIILLIFL